LWKATSRARGEKDRLRVRPHTPFLACEREVERMRQMWVGALLLLSIALPRTAGQDSALVCYDGPFESVLLNGCVDDCRSFETLEEVPST